MKTNHEQNEVSLFPPCSRNYNVTPPRKLFTLSKSMRNGHGSMNDEYKIMVIAVVCHQANKAWCEANQDKSQKDWGEAEEWQRESAIKGVEFALDNPDAPDSAQHDAWMADKVANGWVYGEVKDTEAKTHPCIVPYEQLPLFQQKKDALFKAIVNALK